VRPFEHKDRYDYALNQSSLVLDCGGYHGEFANEIYRRFKCHVHIYEPVQEFLHHIKIADDKKMFLHPFGVAAVPGIRTIKIMGDMSGPFAPFGDEAVVPVVGIQEVAHIFFGPIDLLKLNIEGMEYEVLERILECGIATKFKNIQVQFHRIPDCQKRIDAIRAGLSKTHEQKYCTDFIFEGWSIKP
jgi:FkbM family methyltransferase